MRITIRESQLYPIYYMEFDQENIFGQDQPVEVSEETYDRWTAATNAYWEAQKEMSRAFIERAGTMDEVDRHLREDLQDQIRKVVLAYQEVAQVKGFKVPRSVEVHFLGHGQCLITLSSDHLGDS